MGTHVDPRHAKTERYAEDLAEIVAAEVCPFCPENFHWHDHPIIARDGKWFITESSHPYENSQMHFLIIGQEHKVILAELTGTDMSCILRLAAKVQYDNGLRGGALLMRWGETFYSGATVAHLHAHLVVPRVDPPGEVQPVWFPIG